MHCKFTYIFDFYAIFDTIFFHIYRGESGAIAYGVEIVLLYCGITGIGLLFLAALVFALKVK